MQNIEAVHPQVAAVDVGGGVAFWMAHMQPGAGGVGEHIQNISAFLRRDAFIFCGFEGLIIIPELLPSGFYFVKRISTHDGDNIDKTTFVEPWSCGKSDCVLFSLT